MRRRRIAHRRTFERGERCVLSSAATPIDSLVQPCEACRLLLARLDYEACIEGEEFAYTFLEARYFIQTGERTRGLRLTA